MSQWQGHLLSCSGQLKKAKIDRNLILLKWKTVLEMPSDDAQTYPRWFNIYLIEPIYMSQGHSWYLMSSSLQSFVWRCTSGSLSVLLGAIRALCCKYCIRIHKSKSCIIKRKSLQLSRPAQVLRNPGKLTWSRFSLKIPRLTSRLPFGNRRGRCKRCHFLRQTRQK